MVECCPEQVWELYSREMWNAFTENKELVKYSCADIDEGTNFPIRIQYINSQEIVAVDTPLDIISGKGFKVLELNVKYSCHAFGRKQ